MATATYYFDASVAGPTDSGANWSSDSLAFDGDTGASASSTGTGFLSGVGTDAPSTGDPISSVQFRVHYMSATLWALDATVEEDSVGGTVLLDLFELPAVTPTSDWSAYFVVTPPSPTGWTWGKLQNLAVSFDAAGSNRTVSRAEILVTTEKIGLPSNQATDLYDYQVGTGTTLAFSLPGQFYADASDAGPTVVSGAWSTTSNAFDGDSTTTSQCTSNGVLKGTGTTATSIGTGKISMIGGNSGTPFYEWEELTVPSGGWTLAKAQALHVVYEYDGTAFVNIDVYESDGGALLNSYRDFFADTRNGVWFVPYSVDDYLLVLAAGDDDAETWATPVDSVSGAATEFFQVNDTGGDDASIGGWYEKLSGWLGITLDLVRSATEEQVGVLMVVQGADQTTFEDLAFSLTTPAHFVSTLNVDGTPDITPQPITTVTDDALVIILTGNRSSQPHISKTNIPPYTWDVTAPSGYTIESDNTDVFNLGHAYSAPSRLQQGTGAGDAQMTWMWKTVTTAGTETPADITGFTGGRDMKTVTFAIRPAVAAAAVYPPFPRRSPTQVRM